MCNNIIIMINILLTAYFVRPFIYMLPFMFITPCQEGLIILFYV